VGKAKRVRGTLYWALEADPDGGERFVSNLISLIQGCSGFRESSPNFVSLDAIKGAQSAFRGEGYELTSDGELHPVVLDNLSGSELTDALEAYVRRAQRGIEDAALVTGTGKDLLEATAAYILQERWGTYKQTVNFPTLLGQAFIAVGLATPEDTKAPNEPSQKQLERALYELGCAVNQLRNKEGTGHGRPWLPTVSESEARIAVEAMGIIARRLLDALKGL